MMAAKHEIGVKVLFSHSSDHYVRTYATVNYGARVADKSVRLMGYILHCFSCFHRETSAGIVSPLKHVCPNCKTKLSVAGPLWLGKIGDKNFCSLIGREAEGRSLRQEKRILKLLSLVQNETEAPVTYYTVDKICDKLNLPIPGLKKILNRIRKEGFQAVPTHFNSRGFRTGAPANVVTESITDLSTQKS
jgi:tRNA (guanine26-N2/guanine27-N2)-dimethyltransferase